MQGRAEIGPWTSAEAEVWFSCASQQGALLDKSDGHRCLQGSKATCRCSWRSLLAVALVGHVFGHYTVDRQWRKR